MSAEKMVHIKATRGDDAVVTAFHFESPDAQDRLDAYIAKQQREGYAVEITGETLIEHEVTTREAIYDAEIAPLMTQIVAVCRRADIPIVASFQLDDDRPDGSGLFCSTLITDETTAMSLRRAAAAIKRG